MLTSVPIEFCRMYIRYWSFLETRKVHSNLYLIISTFNKRTVSFIEKESVQISNPDDMATPSPIIKCAKATGVNNS